MPVKEDTKLRKQEIEKVLELSIGDCFEFQTKLIKSWKTMFYARKRELDPQNTKLFSFLRQSDLITYKVWRIK